MRAVNDRPYIHKEHRTNERYRAVSKRHNNYLRTDHALSAPTLRKQPPHWAGNVTKPSGLWEVTITAQTVHELSPGTAGRKKERAEALS